MPTTNPKRSRLTTAARHLLHASGYNQTTLSDIAREADIPLGNVYYYFKTKEALAQAVIEEHLAEFRQLTRELDRMSDPRARIDGFLSMLVLDSKRIAVHGCPIASLCLELNKGEGPLADMANGLMQAQLDWLSEQFRHSGKSDEAGDLALQLLVEVQGAMLLTHIFRDPDMLTRLIAASKSHLMESGN
jgi:TetR/AcrR family transcriptional repressor of nem operon